MKKYTYFDFYCQAKIGKEFANPIFCLKIIRECCNFEQD